ncbi:hypothetical protein CEXT_401831 [Caerostris extrusa]|uniref:LAGLIDADG homing endonuclease n=1 Tax=Caerostris extrusa TaxID=172846 RepID=A0AAV4T3N1_CAEEX|nr:hypothetical protein CEXT_401831 [Caerostris extrusa]
MGEYKAGEGQAVISHRQQKRYCATLTLNGETDNEKYRSRRKRKCFSTATRLSVAVTGSRLYVSWWHNGNVSDAFKAQFAYAKLISLNACVLKWEKYSRNNSYAIT